MIVDRTNAVGTKVLTRCGDHDLLSFGTPHRAEGWQPTQVELVGVIEDGAGLKVVSDVFNRLFLSSYSGSGLLTLCCGRLKTIPWSASSCATVTLLTRIPRSSARKSASR